MSNLNARKKNPNNTHSMHKRGSGPQGERSERPQKSRNQGNQAWTNKSPSQKPHSGKFDLQRGDKIQRSDKSEPRRTYTKLHKEGRPEVAARFGNQMRRPMDAPPPELYIWGRHVVESYLSHLNQQENIERGDYSLHIIVDKQGKAPQQLKPAVEMAKFLGIKTVTHSSTEQGWPLDENADLNHQRVCLKIPEYPTKDLSDALSFISQAKENEENGCTGIVLDQIQDPRNFGAIIRSAAYFGIKFIVYATDRQAAITPLVLKTSAGGAFSVTLIPVTNINRALGQLKDAGAWIVGTALAEEKSVTLDSLPRDRIWVAVMGNEAKGLRSEVLKNCDYVAKIPGKPMGVDSLNVSVATGIFIHSLT